MMLALKTSGDLRGAFRQCNEGLEYYMAYHKLVKDKGKPLPQDVMANMTAMLDAAEKLKAASGHLCMVFWPIVRNTSRNSRDPHAGR